MSEQSIKDLKKEIYLLMHKTQEMLELAEDGFMKNKLSSLDQADALAREVHAREDVLTDALAKMSATNSEARILLTVPSHIEKAAHCIKGIIEGSRARIRDGILFSDKAMSETAKLFTMTKDVLKKAAEAAVTSTQAAGHAAITDADGVERTANDFATAHEDRLVSGECSARSSSTYLFILYAFEDMGGHIKNAVKRLSGQ